MTDAPGALVEKSQPAATVLRHLIDLSDREPELDDGPAHVVPVQLVVAATSNNVTVRDCSGGDSSNVNWAGWDDGGSGVLWFNNHGENCFFRWTG